MNISEKLSLCRLKTIRGYLLSYQYFYCPPSPPIVFGNTFHGRTGSPAEYKNTIKRHLRTHTHTVDKPYQCSQYNDIILWFYINNIKISKYIRPRFRVYLYLLFFIILCYLKNVSFPYMHITFILFF